MAIAEAFSGLNLHSTFNSSQALLIEQPIQLDGKVIDEDPSRTVDGDALLGGQGTTFASASNQYFAHSGQLTATGKTKLTVGVKCRNVTASDGVLGEWENSGNQNGWMVYSVSGGFRIYLSSSGSSATKIYEITADITAENYIVFDVNSDTVRIWLNGKPATPNKIADSTLSSLFDGAEYRIGGVENGAGALQGSVSIAWHANDVTLDDVDSRSADEAARDLYLNRNTSAFNDFFDFYGRCIGDTCFDQTSNANHLTPTNSPTLDASTVRPDYLDPNNAGYSFGNKGRFNLDSVSEGDSFTFEIKTTDDNFLLLHDTDHTDWALLLDDGSVGSASAGDASEILVDGIDHTSDTQDELHTAIADGTKKVVKVTLGSAASTWSGVEWGNWSSAAQPIGSRILPPHPHQRRSDHPQRYRL